VLLLFLFGIARFFEQRRQKKTTGQTTPVIYPLLLIPVVFFAVSAILYTVSGSLIVGLTTADLLRIVGGLILIYVGYSLLNTMVGGHS